MPAELIDGRAVSAAIREEIRREVEDRVRNGHRPPGLAVVLVGEDPASQTYVRNKTLACQEAGFHSRQIDRPATITQQELLHLVRELNADPQIDGILVQSPLPRGIDEAAIVNAIDPDKDVDGFHPVNAGRLATGLPGFVPCTPLGVCELLSRHGIETKGRFAVIVGRSNIVGKPMAQLLLRKAPGGNATVCVCHSATPDIARFTRQADILIAAMGRPRAITADMVKPGAVVIDVGINRIEDASRKSGFRLAGDVDFDGVREVASWITPVPGGVGPMTIAMLLGNTLASARRRDPPN